MKCRTIIDKEREEEVLIYVHRKTKLAEAIEELVLKDTFELIGYKEKNAYRLSPTEVYCFTVENNKVYALCEKEKLFLKKRLYQLEESLPKDFIKINQSCIANVGKIERFDASLSGSLIVFFKNGHSDYVSRRQLKNVKERLGF